MWDYILGQESSHQVEKSNGVKQRKDIKMHSFKPNLILTQ
jgi:hypothetical protein